MKMGWTNNGNIYLIQINYIWMIPPMTTQPVFIQFSPHAMLKNRKIKQIIRCTPHPLYLRRLVSPFFAADPWT